MIENKMSDTVVIYYIIENGNNYNEKLFFDFIMPICITTDSILFLSSVYHQNFTGIFYTEFQLLVHANGFEISPLTTQFLCF